MEYICRCCQAKIESSPVLHFENMPGAAQGFLDEKDLAKECGMDLELHQCVYCGLIQILGEPVSYYKDVIRASAVSAEMKEFRTKYFKEFVDKYNLSGKKVIEIGAGCGEFLNIMNLAGVDGYGLEHLIDSVQKCKVQGLNVFEGFIDDADYMVDKAPYDGFFIMNYLEHIPSPNKFLKGIHNNLTENGIGLIEVPNVDMILEKQMFSEFISDHLMYFRESTLRILLEKNGFEVLDCQPVWHNYCLAAIVRKRKKDNFENLYENLKTISKEINEYIDKYYRNNQKVAVWGAGHQALAVIALCKIKDKLEFIIDSAPFKQNKYTPGTHLRIVGPDTIKKEKIDAVLIMAASYSDEVARNMKEKYRGVEIAILRDYGLEMR